MSLVWANAPEPCDRHLLSGTFHGALEVPRGVLPERGEPKAAPSQVTTRSRVTRVQNMNSPSERLPGAAGEARPFSSGPAD